MKGRLVAASLQQRTLSKPGLSNSWSLQACNREGRAEEMKGVRSEFSKGCGRNFLRGAVVIFREK
ncbi:hypothetical protein HanPSC8_Chr05g0226561 [Helianthus annuus]|nr:hypothetical protein HanPSC8_Chr05g0226561 [Helianthus annuus]